MPGASPAVEKTCPAPRNPAAGDVLEGEDVEPANAMKGSQAMKAKAQKIIGLVVVLPLIAAWAAPTYAQRSDKKYEHQYSRLDVEFPGGTLSEYVDQLRQSRPDGAANVLVMPNAEKLLVPPVTLVAVDVEAAVRMLEGMYVLPDGRKARVDVQSYSIGDSPDLVMKITAEYDQIDIRASVWNLTEALMNGQTAEELLGAVEAVLSLFPEEKAKVSYHPPTRLLIARGTDEQLDLVREAIDELTEGAERRRDRIEDLRNDIGEHEEELQMLVGEMKIAEQVLSLAKLRLSRSKDRFEEGAVAPENVAGSQIPVTRNEAHLDNLKMRSARIQAKLDSLKEALKKLEEPRE